MSAPIPARFRELLHRHSPEAVALLTAAELLPALTDDEQLLVDVRDLFANALAPSSPAAVIVDALVGELFKAVAGGTYRLGAAATMTVGDLVRRPLSGPLFELVDAEVEVIDNGGDLLRESRDRANGLDEESAEVGGVSDVGSDLVDQVEQGVGAVDQRGRGDVVGHDRHEGASDSSVAPAPLFGPAASTSAPTEVTPEGTADPRRNPGVLRSGGPSYSPKPPPPPLRPTLPDPVVPDVGAYTPPAAPESDEDVRGLALWWSYRRDILGAAWAPLLIMALAVVLVLAGEAWS